MNVQAFLVSLCRDKIVPSFPVVCFSGKEYPLLFFSHLIPFLYKNVSMVHRIELTGTDIGLLRVQLAMENFSGNSIYWLSNFHLLAAKKQQEWFTYLQSYTGPHKILFFCDQSINSASSVSSGSMKVITMPDTIAQQDFSLISFLVHGVVRKQTNFIPHVFAQVSSLSLDNACLFAHYEMVIGQSADDFFDEWMVRIVELNSSLFVLSQHFFSKKSRPFFEQWAHTAENYAPPFWATFWADQIWRAYIYCTLMKQKKYDEAKKAQYKLPYSFTNRDWSQYCLIELQRAHHVLSAVDFQLKNGGSVIALELFYTEFFENKYK